MTLVNPSTQYPSNLSYLLNKNTMMTNFIASTTVAVAVFAASAAARTMTVKNNCGYTIWPALYTDLNVSPSRPDHPTGWQQDAHQTVSFNVPNDWRAGRIWVSGPTVASSCYSPLMMTATMR